MSSLQLQLLGHILMKLLEQVTWMTCLMKCFLQNSLLTKPSVVVISESLLMQSLKILSPTVTGASLSLLRNTSMVLVHLSPTV